MKNVTRYWRVPYILFKSEDGNMGLIWQNIRFHEDRMEGYNMREKKTVCRLIVQAHICSYTYAPLNKDT